MQNKNGRLYLLINCCFAHIEIYKNMIIITVNDEKKYNLKFN
jgi:hypothetical protein